MPGPGTKPSLLFQLIIPATAVFIVTIMSLIAVVFSDQRAPVAQFLNRHGNALLLTEFFVVIILSLLAIAQDRRRTRLAMRNTQLPENNTSGDRSLP